MLPQSVTSAKIYSSYAIYLILLMGMYIIFIPTYGIARLWDTTWGKSDKGFYL